MTLLFLFFSSQVFAFELSNQHEQKLNLVEHSYSHLLYASDMEGYKLLNSYLVSNPESIKHLSSHRLLYVAEISKMPSLISRMFAIPKMKKLNYSIFLDKTGEVTKDWEKTPNGITVLSLNKGEYLKITHSLKSLDEIKTFFNNQDKN